MRTQAIKLSLTPPPENTTLERRRHYGLINHQYDPNQRHRHLCGIGQRLYRANENFARDIGAGLKTLVGGEIKAYTQMMSEARQIAIGRMVDEAKALGANAVVGFRLESSTVMAGASELIAYGTAVIVK